MFYMHDTVGGSNLSAVRVAGRSNFTGSNPIAAMFGSIYMMDNPLTVTPALNSTVMGRAQGFMCSTEEYWKRQDTAQAIGLFLLWRLKLVWEGLGLGGGAAVGDWSRKGGVWVGHLLSGYSLPMEDLGQSKQTNVEGVGGTWREAIKLSCETTKAAFPGGEVMAHLDHKWTLFICFTGNLTKAVNYLPMDAGASKVGKEMPLQAFWRSRTLKLAN
ncbi:unnamed protein product [Camellia sinensis]